MTRRTTRIRKYMLFVLKICTFGKIKIQKNLMDKGDLLLVMFAILMAAMDVQQNFMPTTYIFFLSIGVSVRSKVLAFFSEKFTKVEHTICDCN